VRSMHDTLGTSTPYIIISNHTDSGERIRERGRTITKRDVAAVTLGPIVISNVYGRIRFGDMVDLVDGLRDIAGGIVGEMKCRMGVGRHG
jgi:hypothetical protein